MPLHASVGRVTIAALRRAITGILPLRRELQQCASTDQRNQAKCKMPNETLAVHLFVQYRVKLIPNIHTTRSACVRRPTLLINIPSIN